MDYRTKLLLATTAAVVSVSLAVTTWYSEKARRTLIENLPMAYKAFAGPLAGTFSGLDADRKQQPIVLVPIVNGTLQPTDVQFEPTTGVMLVLEQKGKLRWFHDGAEGLVIELPVRFVSEEGLLGLAFHPNYTENHLFYMNLVVEEGGQDVSVVEEFTAIDGDITQGAIRGRRILQQIQPYQNHDAGQLQFGPDGMLYIGWGDGGFRADPHDNAQDGRTWLGSMLRVDIDNKDEGLEYAVPPDNPFVGQDGFRPETWAYGLRNPWRYSFTPSGQLVMADVGQDLYEEISIIPKGGNMGWKVWESQHCFSPKTDCPSEGFVPALYEYGRDDGNSITGGYTYTGSKFEELNDLWIFGDFVTGRLWGIDLDTAEVTALGRWPVLPSSFGRDPSGEIYVADYGSGTIFRISKP